GGGGWGGGGGGGGGRGGPPRVGRPRRGANTRHSPLPPGPRTAAPPRPARPTAGSPCPRSAAGWSARNRDRRDACPELRSRSADGRSPQASPAPRPPRPDRDRARPRSPAQRPDRGASPALTRCGSCLDLHERRQQDGAPPAFLFPRSLLPQKLSSSTP